MFLVLLFIAELLVLFILSKTLTSLLFAFFYKLTRNNIISIYLMSFLFLPGTIIHELSHAAMALLLFVPVGKMEFWPQLHTDGLKLGSVKIAKTDPIRRVLIGSAPFLLGTAIILSAFFYGIQNGLFNEKLFIAAITYITFQIGNTMYSNKKDVDGAIEVIFATAAILAILYLAGIRFSSLYPDVILSNPEVEQVLQKGTLYLSAPVLIDCIAILLIKLFKSGSD